MPRFSPVFRGTLPAPPRWRWDRMFPRKPSMRRRRIAEIGPQRASGFPVQPCGLVCEVMACRSGHTGRGLVGSGLCSAFPARPQVPVDRGTGHAQEP